MNTINYNKVREICRWYKANSPSVVRLFILNHLMINQLENFNVRDKKRIQANVFSIQNMIMNYYVTSNKNGKLKFHTTKALRNIPNKPTKEIHTKLENLLFEVIDYYDKNLKNVKRFKLDDSAIRALTTTGNFDHGITVQGFLDEIRTVLK